MPDGNSLPVPGLPVLALLSRSLAQLIGRPDAFLRAAALPFAMSLLIGLVAGRLAQSGLGQPSGGWSLLVILVAALGYLPLLLFGDRWMLFVTHGAPAGRLDLIPQLEIRHWKLFLTLLKLIAYFLAITAATTTLFIAMGALFSSFLPALSDEGWAWLYGVSVTVIAVLLAAGICLKFLYVLPAAALGHEVSLKRSWQDSRGQWWRLAFASLLVILPFAGLSSLLQWLFVALLSGTEASFLFAALAGLIYQILNMALLYCMTGLLLGFLALAYQAGRTGGDA